MLVNTVSVLLYKKLGVSNADIAYYTSLLALPWVIKPLWGPVVDLYWTKRRWVLLMQFMLVLTFGAMALALQSPMWWIASLGVFAVAAILSATHDIAADGFYMIGLSEHRQTLFVGIRSTFYRFAMIFGTGLLVIFAGIFEAKTGPEPVTLQVTAVPRGAAVQVPQAEPASDEFLRFEPRTLAVEAGTTAAVSVSLAKPPAKDGMTTVAIGRKSSSALSAFFPLGPEQLIKIDRGDQLEFSDANWNQPQEVVFAADAKLKEQTSANFRATAGDFRLTWTICFAAMAGLFLLLFLLHAVVLPKPAMDGMVGAASGNPVAGFGEIFASFFRKRGVLLMIAFLLTFRLSEALLLKVAAPFLLDARDKGGLALTQAEFGLAYGTVGILMLTIGGILGGLAAATGGLKKWIFPMFLSLNLPNAFYWYLAANQPENLGLVFGLVGLEQFGYGFGFAAYMIYMLFIAGQGEHKTSHFALATGFMALSMMLPGMVSGKIYESIGNYPTYFIFVVGMALPGLLLLPFIPLDPKFGKRRAAAD